MADGGDLGGIGGCLVGAADAEDCGHGGAVAVGSGLGGAAVADGGSLGCIGGCLVGAEGADGCGHGGAIAVGSGFGRAAVVDGGGLGGCLVGTIPTQPNRLWFSHTYVLSLSTRRDQKPLRKKKGRLDAFSWNLTPAFSPR